MSHGEPPLEKKFCSDSVQTASQAWLRQPPTEMPSLPAQKSLVLTSNLVDFNDRMPVFRDKVVFYQGLNELLKNLFIIAQNLGFEGISDCACSAVFRPLSSDSVLRSTPDGKGKPPHSCRLLLARVLFG